MFTPTTETGKLWTKKLKALAAELAKGLQTEDDLNQLSMMLTVETALNAELTDHLRHKKMLKNQALIPVTAIHPKPWRQI